MAGDGSSGMGTYLGGSNADFVEGMAVASPNVVWMAGFAHSTDFPTTPGALADVLQGGLVDAFATKLAIWPNAATRATYLPLHYHSQ
jgi:hypothetical protein